MVYSRALSANLITAGATPAKATSPNISDTGAGAFFDIDEVTRPVFVLKEPAKVRAQKYRLAHKSSGGGRAHCARDESTAKGEREMGRRPVA